MVGTAAYVIASACVGYLFCLNCYKFKYSLARKSGYYAYLYCTLFGIGLVALGSVIGHGVFGIDILGPTPKNTNLDPLAVLLAHTTAGVVLATSVLPLINTLYNKTSSIELAWKDDISQLINKAIELEMPVQVTLDSRKVYVGMIYDTLEPDDESSYLSILPLFSGYRDEDTLELTMTHKYQKVLGAFSEQDTKDVSAFRLVIPKDRIITCHIFDGDIYQQARESVPTEIVG